MKLLVQLVLLSAFLPFAAVSARAQCPGSTSALAQARVGIAAVTVGDVAIFAGGRDGMVVTSVISGVVDLYDAATDTWSGTALPTARSHMGGTAVGDLALFAGGTVGPASALSVVEVFDVQTQTWSTGWPLSQPRDSLAATTVGTKALFAGGARNNGTVSARVDVYDSALGPPSDQNAWSTATLSQARMQIAAVTVGTYAIFAGGVDPASSTPFAVVDVYDDSTGQWTTATLSQARSLGSSAAAVAVGDVAFFGGGQLTNTGGMSNVVDVYDSAMGPPDDPTAWSTKTLNVARGHVAAARVGDDILFAGGLETGFVTSAVVDRLDTVTGQWSASCSLSAARWGLGAATAHGMAVFAGGGIDQCCASAAVDVFLPDVGTSYCLSVANSTGSAASISAWGSSSVAANDLALVAQPVPDQPGVFFYGPTQIQQPFGNGFLCIGGGATGLARLSVVFAAGNVLAYTVDNTIPPTPGTQILPGSQWNFSAWYRDPAGLGAFFNLSDALSIQFTP